MVSVFSANLSHGARNCHRCCFDEYPIVAGQSSKRESINSYNQFIDHGNIEASSKARYMYQKSPSESLCGRSYVLNSG